MFVFFKQKTAYEMRISDWSSDVCSSDLLHEQVFEVQARLGEERPIVVEVQREACRLALSFGNQRLGIRPHAAQTREQIGLGRDHFVFEFFVKRERANPREPSRDVCGLVRALGRGADRVWGY